MQIAPHPVTVNIIQEWNWTDVASLALTAALVAVAVVEIWRARAAEKARRRAVDQRISTVAYALERQVSDWVITCPLFSSGIVKPKSGPVMAWAEDIQRHFPAAEVRVLEMIGLAPDANRQVTSATRTVYVKFYRATAVINEACAAKETMLNAAAEQLAIGWTELRDCLASVNKLIDVELVQEAKQFEEVRQRIRTSKQLEQMRRHLREK